MDTLIKEALYKDLNKGTDNINQNKEFIKGTLPIMYLKDRVLCSLQITANIKECGKTVVCQVKEYFLGLMVVGTKGHIKKD
jgi:hypothetical protein